MYKTITTFFILTIALALSCGNQPEAITVIDLPEYETANGISPDTLWKWKLYAESSDNGLWEGALSHYIILNRTASLGGEDDLTPPFYNALNIHTMDDTIMVADPATQELVCMTPEGEVLWKAGASGEGPGLFHGIGGIVSGDNWLAVGNTGLNRIDFFTKTGEFTETFSIDTPQDLVAISDTTFAVISGGRENNVISIINPDSGLIRSFGTIVADSVMTFNMNFRDNLRGTFIPPNIIAVISRYEHKLFIFNLDTEEQIFAGVRDLPSDPAKPYRNYNEETGRMTTICFPSISSVFKGPEGMINVVVDEYQSDGTLLHSNRNNNYAPVTVIDRYDPTGTYLDSYCIPDSGVYWMRMLTDGRFVGAQQGTSMVFIYEPVALIY